MQTMDRFSIDTSRAKSNSQVVSFCAQQLGIREFTEPKRDGQSCDIYWHSVVYQDMKDTVKEGGRVNKFPGMSELAKKVSLTVAIQSMRELFPDEYAFYPQSWVLPAQLDKFKNHCTDQRDADKGQCFIVKPDEGAQGMGIYLINSHDQLKSTTTRQLVQEYVIDPYLLPDELKFDLRVYAVIKSINPLSIYVAREGMARFCTEKYVRPCPENFDKFYAHLTNYSLNKENNAYMHSNSLREQLRGSKRLLSTVFHQMERKGVRTRRLWKDVKLIIAKTVLAMVPEIMLNYEHHFAEMGRNAAPKCFQIMGFDILIREDGSPILLEVNSAPSLTVEHSLSKSTAESAGTEAETSAADQPNFQVRSIVDEMIKVPLVRDCLLLVLDKLQHFYGTKSEKENERREKKAERNSEMSAEEAPQNWEALSANSKGTDGTAAKAEGEEDEEEKRRRARRPHLSEVFPLRYGQVSMHLLVLDRAVYLFLQFVSIRHSLSISLLALKIFLRKCRLTDVMSLSELEKQFGEINSYFNSTGKSVPSGAPALPFHGFLQLFFHIAKLKFPANENGEQNNTLASVVRLFAHCDATLRFYGVRSTRLRRAEVKARHEQRTDGNGSEVSIYLLPSRMPRQSVGGNVAAGEHQPRKKAKQQQHVPNRTRSLPRKFGMAPNIPRKGLMMPN
ncbi:hypothetical protein niasHS_014889 [Heterodera schachtii]|uniref:Tubulin polyglutamylase TTLL11 n=1 Tax=Heterodera schachtii TaxID=97005 RepID=A0ABD2IL12_HETSC